MWAKYKRFILAGLAALAALAAGAQLLPAHTDAAKIAKGVSGAIPVAEAVVEAVPDCFPNCASDAGTK